jgi:hypothetical protein
MLQTAVHAPNTPPMSPAEQALSNRFDHLLRHIGANASSLRAGVRAAHATIIRSYLSHTGATNWVHVNNIGTWGKQVVQRSAITDFCPYCNSITTAGYGGRRRVATRYRVRAPWVRRGASSEARSALSAKG